MKKLFFTLTFVAFASFAYAQTPLPIEITYDAAGNRITRKVLQVRMDSKGGLQADSSYYLDRMQTMQMKVYPNPTQGKIYIEIQEAEETVANTIRIYNSQGQIIHEKEGVGDRMEVDVSSFPAGYYLVELSANGEHSSWKIVKR